MGITKEQKLIRQVIGNKTPTTRAQDLNNGFALPNNSGDHRRGIKRDDPVNDYDLTNKAYVDATRPAGEITMYGNATAPTGWLNCDGTAVSRTTYSNLFAVISTTFGVGNGSTTFNLPNLSQKFPRGKGTIGTTGGSDDAVNVSHNHTFTGSALGTHQHTATTSGSDGGHSHSFTFLHALLFANGVDQLAPVTNGGAGSGGAYPTTDTTGNHGHTITVGSTSAGTPAGTISTEGSSGTNANLPSYLEINFIIKY